MPNNNFKPFSIGGGANVLTQGQYEALTSLIANGFSAGTALSPQLNKVWRQSTIMAAVLGALINDITGQDAIDDGTTTTLEADIFAAILKAGYVADTGAVNAYAITLAPAPLAYYDGMIVGFSTANANTSTTPTLNVNGLGAISIKQVGGAAPVVGQVAAGAYCQAVYRSAGPRFELTTGKFALADGSNASGTWPINAATATNAINAINAINADILTRNIATRAYLSTSLTVPATTDTNIIFQTSEFDTSSGAYSTSTGIFTCQVRGKYLINVYLYVTVNTDGNNGNLYLKRTGSDTNTRLFYTKKVDAPSSMQGNILLNLEVGDTIQFSLYLSAGGSIIQTIGNNSSVSFIRLAE
jgi:hypothetical protein